MSLILEALRRSEAQRRSGRPPALHDPSLPPARQSERPRLAIGIALGIGLGLAVGIGLWLVFDRHTGSAASPSQADDRAADAAPVGPSFPPAASPAAALPAGASPAAALVRELDAPAQAPAAPAATPAPATTAGPAATADPAPVPDRATEPATTTVGTGVAEAMPADDALDLNRLDAASRALLPPLRVSMHVYDPDPMRRFVLIDGRRLREGEALTPELRLVAIERDGLRFDWRGRALHRPR